VNDAVWVWTPPVVAGETPETVVLPALVVPTDQVNSVPVADGPLVDQPWTYTVYVFAAAVALRSVTCSFELSSSKHASDEFFR
jgi:hypothetical protein